MATEMAVRPGEWNELFGIWFYVQPDPLTSTSHVTVTVHNSPAGLWVRARGPNAGVHIQTVQPDTIDQESR